MKSLFLSCIRFFRNVFFTPRFFWGGAFLFGGFVVSFFIQGLFSVVLFAGLIFLFLVIAEVYILFRISNPFSVKRVLAPRLSNGDENPVEVYISSFLSYPSYVQVLDEVPVQFQRRDLYFSLAVDSGETKIIRYSLRPVKRGEYHFGSVHVYFSTRLRFALRRYSHSEELAVPVYPSIIQMHKYAFLAIHNRLTLYGIKKMRRLGHTSEFEKIKEYALGDEVKTINWKSTAKKDTLMVNQYVDERAQPVYSILDMGRTMQMPFEGLSLLDYSINSALVLSNMALLKSDKAGLITFSHKMDSVLLADGKQAQIKHILEVLYRQKTGFLESNFEELFITVRRRINQRSLIMLYTNFESLSAARRQLPYLRAIGRQHVLCIVLFHNSELAALLERNSDSVEEVYENVVAQKFDAEKRQIVKELNAVGIYTLLTSPKQLTVNSINLYLAFKARGII
jgi:uncharacterized protein (DUF58 family)